MTQYVNPPEDQTKIQTFVNMLIQHRNKTKTEQTSKCEIKCISNHKRNQINKDSQSW